MRVSLHPTPSALAWTLRRLAWRLCLALLLGHALAAALHAQPVPVAPVATQAPNLRIDLGMHTQAITGIAADREGRWVATVSADQTLKIWDAGSQQLVRTVLLTATPGLAGTPTAVAMSPDGRSVVVAGYGLAPRLIDRASGALRMQSAPLDARVADLVWSPDGRYIAAALTGDGGFQVFDAQTLKAVGGMAKLPVMGLDIGAGGRTLVYFFDGSLRLFELRDGRSAQVAQVQLTDYWKPRKPGAKRTAWDEPGPGVVRISPDGRRAAVARIGLLRIAVLALPGLETVTVEGSLPVPGVFGPLAWTADGDAVLFANGDWPSSGLGLLTLPKTDDRAAREAPAPWQAWSPEGIAGEHSPMPRPGFLLTVPQGFVFATAEPSWGLFRTDQARSVRVQRVTFDLGSWGGLSANYTYADAQGRAVFTVEAAQGRMQPMLFDPQTLSVQRIDRRQLQYAADPGSGARIDRDQQTLWRDDGGGQRLWSVALPAAPVAATARTEQDERGFVVVKLADSSWRWYRYADGSEMLALFVNRDASRWVAWTPAGEAAGDLDLLRRPVARDGVFDLVEARSGLALRPEAIARATTSPPPGPAGDGLQFIVARPLSGAVPERHLVPVTVRTSVKPALQAIDVSLNDQPAGRVDVAQMRRPATGTDALATYQFDLRLPDSATRLQLAAQFAGGGHSRISLALAKPRRTNRESGDETFFNPTTRDFGTCATRPFDGDELERQLRQRLNDEMVKNLNPKDLGRIDDVYPLEVDIGDALIFAGRLTEAEAWARDRLGRELMRVPSNSNDYPNRQGIVERRIALTELLGRALQPREPLEAEHWFARAHADQLTRWKPENLGCRADQMAEVGGYCESFRSRLVARNRARLWGNLYQAVGRLAEARDVFEAARRAFAEGYHPETEEAATYSARVQAINAQLALREGNLTDAQRQMMAKAPSLALLQSLARTGNLDEVRVVARSLGAEFEAQFPKLFEPDLYYRRCAISFELPTQRHGSYVDPLREASAALDEGGQLALALLAAGDTNGAYRSAEATHATAQRYFGASHPLTLQAQAALARVQAARGRAADALALWRPWAPRFAAAIADQLWGLSEDARRALLRPARANVDALFASLAGAALDGSLQPGDVEMAASVALASRGLLTRTAAELNTLARSRTDASARQTVDQLDRARRELAAQVLRADANPAALAAARARRTDVELRLSTLLQARRPASSVTPDAVRQALKPDETLVELLSFRNDDLPADTAAGALREGVLALVSAADQPTRLLAYPDFGQLSRAAAAYRAAVDPDSLSGAGRAAQVGAAAAALYAAAWGPIAPLVQGRRRVYVVPDGLLATVPLHAMRTPGGEPLAAVVDLRLLNSPRDLVEGPARSRGGASLVVGAPQFGGHRPAAVTAARALTAAAHLQDLWFEPLPGALTEATAVGKLLKQAGGVVVLTGAAATKQSVVAAASPTLMHLATHGYFLDDVRQIDADEDPLQLLALSGLAFSHANEALKGQGNRRDGLLTALEVTGMDLRRTRLVVLSACETGLGRIQNGEGVLGLARAFHEAGAQNVLATLWAVDDDGTRAFMEMFYRELVQGRAPAEALAAVRQVFLRHPRWSDPYFWAPFVLVGN